MEVAENDGHESDPVAPSISRHIPVGKPAWGWDYTFVFRAPAFSEEGGVAPEAGEGVTRNNDSDSETYSPQNVVGYHIDLDEEKVCNDVVMDANQCVVDEETDTAAQEATETRKDILARLRSAGFTHSQIYVPSEKAIFLRFALCDNALQEKAELMEMELPVKEEFGGGYLAFTNDRSACFKNADRPSSGSYFSPSDRIIIILATLQSKEEWGCDMNIERMVYKKKIIQAFAIHSKPEQKELIRTAVWDRWWDPTWQPPFDDLKSYVGARVALYFVFVSFYARNLLVIACLSIPAYTVYRLMSDNEQLVAVLRWIFAMSLVLWTTLFLERWKRRNACININWGLNDYHEDTSDDTRAQFRGEMRHGFYCKGGFVDLSDLIGRSSEESDIERTAGALPGHLSIEELPKNPWQDPREEQNAMVFSICVSAVCVSVVGTFVFLILFFRNGIVDYFETTGLRPLANAMPGVLNGLLISISDPIWRFVSLMLTRNENHRTNQRFENSLVLKRFSFQFISNYSSLFFIAFIKPLFKPESIRACRAGYRGNAPDCLVEVETQMMSLVITKATVQQVLEVGIPFFTSRLKQILARRGGHKDSDGDGAESQTGDEKGLAFASDAVNRYVNESKLPPYHSTIEDYAELVIQFGYLCLFGLAFPLAALVNLLNNLVEVRTDAFKVLAVAQRTNADDTADIGAHYHILQFLGACSVFTNAGLLIYTGNSVENLFQGWGVTTTHKVVAFFLVEHTLFALKACAASLIKDIPGRTHRILARQDFDLARFFGVGWQNAFRGTSLLEVKERHREMASRNVNMFVRASFDGKPSKQD